MKITKINNIFFILLIFLFTNQFIVSKIYQDISSDYDIDYMENTNRKKIYSQKYGPKSKFQKKQSNFYDNEFNERPTSTFDFLWIYFKNRVYSYFDSFNDYFDGLEFILSKYKYLFRRYSSHKIINKTLSHSSKVNYGKDFSKNKKYVRHLEENKRTFKLKLKQNQSYPYNNTNLYNNYTCATSPNLKVFYYYYFCNGKKVSKSTYERKISQGENCEFYNNTMKLCFCPIHYSSCKLRSQSRIRCMSKEVLVNNDINLTKNYDTFYDEFFKSPILDNDKKIFNFSVKLKCGMAISDSITGSNTNFYLSNANDENADFDIISTVYNNTYNGTQYTKEEVMNNTNNILEYFIKRQNLVIYLKPKIYLSFSIIDQQWALPYKIKYYEISEDLIDDIFSGNRYFNFTVDLNDIIKNQVGVGPFSTKDFPYPYFDKGDIYFFEINMEDKEKQVYFYPFRGEIKK